MKTCVPPVLAVTFFILLTTAAPGAEFSAPHQENKALRQGAAAHAAPVKPFAPKPSGAIYEMSEKGLIVISPWAPVSYGYGQSVLARNPFPGRPADQTHADTVDFGGIKLLGFDF